MTERTHVRKDYATDEIVVHWDSARCAHTANCLNALSAVFDVRRRPWVRIDAADADAIAAAVDTCPTGALTYTRHDGGHDGPAARAVIPPPEHDATATATSTPVVIALRPNGPLVVEGPVRIELARGEVLEVTDRAVLCRCGNSASKPFCDGSHKRVGFEAEGW